MSSRYRLRTSRLTLTLAAAAALASSQAALAQPAPASEAAVPASAPTPGDRTFKLTNTGRAGIRAIYAAPAGTLDLSDDLLGKQVASGGKTVTLKAADPRAVCVFDLEFLMDNGDTVTRKGVDLCQTTAYAFTP